jgi:hypothetical protein
VIQSVGTAEFGGEKCRWIELKAEVAAKKDKSVVLPVRKMLIPERDLKGGGNPFDHVKVMYVKAAFVKDGLERVDTNKALFRYELDLLA